MIRKAIRENFVSAKSTIPDDLIKIGDVADQAGITPRALRYYEERGLIEPYRTKKGTRRYSEKQIARVKAAMALIELDVNLDDVLALTRARPGSPSGSVSSRKVLRELHKLRQKIEAKRDKLSNLLKDIDQAAALVSTCLDCELVPNSKGCPECPCEKKFFESPLLSLTWSANDES